MARFYDQGKTKLQEKKMSIEVEPNAARKMTRPPGHFAHLVISLLSFFFLFLVFLGLIAPHVKSLAQPKIAAQLPIS
jgi:hypothetical protein